MRRMTKNDDRGAVAVIVAILMVALIGFAAIGVDIANMASDKQQLQNGADAAAFSIAEDCAKGECSGTYDRFAVAEALADNNKNDGEATVTSVDVQAQKVTVVVQDETEHWFARIWDDSSTVSAKATVSWTWNITSMGGLPLAMDENYLSCVAEGAPEIFTGAASSGTFVKGDNGFWEYTGESEMVRLYLADWANDNSSEHGISGCEIDGNWTPGGFGWLETDGSTCHAETAVEEPAIVDPGVSPSNGCKGQTLIDLIDHAIALPVFQGQDASGSGSHGQYIITGYVAFVIDGVNVPTASEVGKTGFKKAKDMCEHPDAEKSANEHCIVGHFTTAASLDGTGSLGGDDSGAYILKLEE